MSFAYGLTMTIYPRESVDEWGDRTEGEPVTVQGAMWFDQGTEYLDGRDTITSRAQAVVPPGTEVHATDRIEVNGASWEVTGEPNEWSSPFTGWKPGVQVFLTRVEG